MIDFSEQDRDALATWLTSQDEAMPIAQLEGYLFALICAPSPIVEETWLTQALGQQLSANLPEEVLFSLMAYHNAISEHVFETGYSLSARIAIEQQASDNLSQHAPLHLWSLGFALGVQHYITEIVESDELSEAFSQALAMTLGYLCFFADLDNDASHSGEVISLLDEFTLGYAELIESAVLDANLVDDEFDQEID